MKKRILALISAFTLAILLSACGTNDNDMGSDIRDNVESFESAIDNPSSQNTSSAKISADEAKSTALKHAGFTEDDVTALHTDLDRDDGTLKYEVEFRKDNKEYDYDINAETGEIISYDNDID